MGTRERPADRGRRQGIRDAITVGEEIRRARVGAGLSLRAVATAADVDHVQLWRFERGFAGALRLDQISAVGAVVGLDIRLKAFLAGDPIRDAGQARLLERLRREVHPSLRWRTEVPLPISADQRAWDAMISGPNWRLAVDAETVLNDIQALERRLTLKQRDGGVDHVLLLVADTPRNRRARAAAPASFAALTGNPREVLVALRQGRDPGASALIFH